MTDDTIDETDLYLEGLAQALFRLGIVEMEGVVLDGSEAAGAVMLLDTQLTAGWQLAESVRLSQEAEARLASIDASADLTGWEEASLDMENAHDAMMPALNGWDEAEGFDDSDVDLAAAAA